MKPSEALDRLVQVSEKLLMETARLRRDVQTLNSRIMDFEDSEGPTQLAEPFPRKKANILDAINEIEVSRKTIRECEIDLRRIESRLSVIVDHEASREEMKKFIRQPDHSGKGHQK